jgi:hypothetical protein
MGKKAKLKKIRRMASQMPVINVGHVQGSTVHGGELLKRGVKEVEGKPVGNLQNYREKKVVPQAVNHNRQMKRLYNQQGVKGVIMYAQAVKRFVDSQKAPKVQDATTN